MNTVQVRAQALGGKFLGAAVASTPPVLQVFQGQTPFPVAQQFVTQDSGQVGPPGPDTTGYPIIVQPNPNPQIYAPGTYYLAPASTETETDSFATVNLPLIAQPLPYTFVVTAANSDTGSTVTSSITVELWTGSPLLNEPGVVVPIPGLRITGASALAAPGGTIVTANVAMMCGCMITPTEPSQPPAEAYWPASEFLVTVSAGSHPPFPLDCTGNSVFTAGILGLPPGYPVLIAAQQIGNAENSNAVIVQVSAASAPAP